MLASAGQNIIEPKVVRKTHIGEHKEKKSRWRKKCTWLAEGPFGVFRTGAVIAESGDARHQLNSFIHILTPTWIIFVSSIKTLYGPIFQTYHHDSRHDMTGQEIAQPNPPPDASHLPDSLLELRVKLNIKDALSQNELKAVRTFRRAADYIAAGQSS